MALKDEIQKSIVIVNSGSGCLIQPMDAEKLYVLTAKHVLVDTGVSNTPVIECWVVEDGSGCYKMIETEELQEGVNYFPHDELDAAILAIPSVEGFKPMLGVDLQVNWGDEYILCGYPAMRRNSQAKFRPDEVVIKNQLSIRGVHQGQIVSGQPGLKEVMGQSGGGYIRESNGHLLIGGIQTQMVCEDDVEQLGWVKILLIEVFHEIVEKHDQLKPLVPSFMDSFENFRSKAMALRTTAGQTDMRVVRTHLQNITSKITATELRPLDIKNKYGERLLVWQRMGSLLDERMWTSFLELLIVWSVCNNDPVTTESLEQFLNKIRFLHANFGDDWIFYPEEIMRSNFLGLEPGGVVVVSDSTVTATFDLSGIVANISIPDTDLQIDQGASIHKFRYVHITAFQKKAILAIHDQYAAFAPGDDPGPLNDKLHQEFKKVLNG